MAETWVGVLIGCAVFLFGYYAERKLNKRKAPRGDDALTTAIKTVGELIRENEALKNRVEQLEKKEQPND